MAAYYILNYDVLDQEQLDKYFELVNPILDNYIKKGQARVLINEKSFPEKIIQGNALKVFIIVEFENHEIFQEFYYSDQYQHLNKIRMQATSGWSAHV